MVSNEDVTLIYEPKTKDNRQSGNYGYYLTAIVNGKEARAPVTQEIVNNAVKLKHHKQMFINKLNAKLEDEQKQDVDIDLSDIDELTKDELIEIAMTLDLEWSSRDKVEDLAQRIKDHIVVKED